MGTPLTLTTIHRGATTIVAVCGELDLVTAPRLTDELAGIAGDVHLDCHRLAFLDCAGIGALIAGAPRVPGPRP